MTDRRSLRRKKSSRIPVRRRTSFDSRSTVLPPISRYQLLYYATPLTPLEAYFFTLFVLHFVYSEHDRTFYKRHECKAICNLLECDVVCLNTSMQPTLSPRPNNNHMTNPPPPPPRGGRCLLFLNDAMFKRCDVFQFLSMRCFERYFSIFNDAMF